MRWACVSLVFCKLGKNLLRDPYPRKAPYCQSEVTLAMDGRTSRLSAFATAGSDRAELESVEFFRRRFGWIGRWEDIVLGCRHRGVALSVLPKELIEQRRVDCVSMSEIDILAFRPFLSIHLIDQTVVAVAVVGSERRLLTGSAEERGHYRGT